MATNYIQNGSIIEFTASSDVSSGAPIAIGNLIAVSLQDKKAGEVGAFAIEGVFELPKNGGVISVGDSVAFDISEGVVVPLSETHSAGDLISCGVAFSASGAGSDLIHVKLNTHGAEIIS